VRRVDQYVLRVLADQWATPARTPSLLDVSRRGDGIVEALARAGFRVSCVTLEDSSLETLSERLVGMSRHFDAVVIRDVLEVVEDWREVVIRAARRLRPGGVLVYGVSESAMYGQVGRFLPWWLRSRLRTTVSTGELIAILRRIGLLPRELISLGAESIEGASRAYVGHSVMRADLAPSTPMRWDMTDTGERWIARTRA
jgi:SAM-dependent methyltransferase